jgi:hypothetical protein
MSQSKKNLLAAFANPNTRSWANIANNNSQKERAARHATRRARGERSRTPTAASLRAARHASRRARGEASKTPSPVRSGNTRGQGENTKIYSRGRWVKAVDPEGDYGGPYATMAELLRDHRYISDMKEFAEDKAIFNKYINGLQRRVRGAPGLNRAEARALLRQRGIPSRRSRSPARNIHAASWRGTRKAPSPKAKTPSPPKRKTRWGNLPK